MSVTLRETVDADLEIFFQHQLDAEAGRMAAFTRKDPTDRDAFMIHWQKIRNDETVVLRTILKESEVAGSIASYVDPHIGGPEVTYWIGREFWGQGVATAALELFLRVQTTRPLYGRAASDNAGSLRVLEKCGFKLIGSEKGFANARGEEIDESILRLDA